MDEEVNNNYHYLFSFLKRKICFTVVALCPRNRSIIRNILRLEISKTMTLITRMFLQERNIDGLRQVTMCKIFECPKGHICFKIRERLIDSIYRSPAAIAMRINETLQDFRHRHPVDRNVPYTTLEFTQ